MPEAMPTQMNQLSTANAENSNTVKLALASQKRWRIAGVMFGSLASVGVAAAAGFHAVPAAFFGGLATTGVGLLGVMISAVFSGAEVDEAFVTKVANRVATMLEDKGKAS